MHVTTRRNLHSHHFSSPLSHNQEVSAFGEGGDGDEGIYAIGTLNTPLFNKVL
jgi:dolichyl-phosphate-mannose--protein O-mannosyl transferase